MKNTIPRTLLIATTSYAGMGPYVAAIVNSFEKDDNVRFFLVEREDKYYTRNIKEELKPLCTIYQEKTPSKIQTLLEISFNRKPPYYDMVADLCKSEKIEIVHSLSSMSNIKLAKYLNDNYKLLYTVHDLHPHEAKKAFYKEWRQNVLYKRTFQILDHIDYFYTNSRSQLEELKTLYPKKEYFYTPFPSLVTKEIAEGNMKVPELAGIDNYVLFFGRIEAYKGVEILVSAFKKAKLPKSVKLVIAGKGEVNIDKGDEDVILINRYIDDREIKDLYSKALCVVYPYISGTQSGVLSVASYFGTPMITSDIPFFKEIFGENLDAMFKSNDADDLSNKLKLLFQTQLDKLKEISLKIYIDNYDQKSAKDRILEIYKHIEAS